MANEITREHLAIGMLVKINPKDDKTRKIFIKGQISEILTKSNKHPHGIMVKLESGEIGRVKELLNSTSEILGNSLESSSMGEKPPTIEDLIEKGEDHFIEFKTSTLWSKFKTKEEINSSKSHELKKYGKNASKYIIAKSLCGFLNSDGGILVIGVKEVKDSDEIVIVGIESEYGKLKDKTIDGYRRMILDEVIKPFLPSEVFNHFNKYFKFYVEIIDEKTVLGIKVKPADFRIFVSIAKEDIFFIRIDASTRQISGPELVDYCTTRFK